jgi:hypothetical protein
MDRGEGLATGPRHRARRAASIVGVAVVAVGAIIGGDLFGVRESVFGSATPAPRDVAVSPFVTVNTHGHATKSVLTSQPWWQGVRDLSGSATSATTAAFTIGAGSSQWRARWSCTSGSLTVTLAGHSRSLISSGCPGTGTAYVTRTGAETAKVVATGPWTLRIDQQVDVPLVEPPLAAMTAPGTTVAYKGSFYGIAQKSVGTLTVYRYGSGRYALRLTSFYVSPNVDLQLRFDVLRAPHSTHQYVKSRSVFVAPLNVTTGSMNFLVPRSVDPTQYRSLVIWCPLILSAYAGATLNPAG